MARLPQQAARVTPNPSIRTQIDAGPHFVPTDGICIACGGFGQCAGKAVDEETGLGEACWRVWRWSPIRERKVEAT